MPPLLGHTRQLLANWWCSSVAEIVLDTQAAPTTPAASKGVIYIDTNTERPAVKNDAGVVSSHKVQTDIATQNLTGVDTYLTVGGFTLPSGGLQVGSLFKWSMYVSKTAFGVAAPIYRLRCGTLGTTGDAAVCTMTGTAQTANADFGLFEFYLAIRSVGAAGVAQAAMRMNHSLLITGFTTLASHTPVLVNTSAGFDTTTVTKVGISIDPGASAVWTCNVIAEMFI